MAGMENAKVESDTLEAEKEFRHEVESRQEARITGERNEQQVLNQGMDTGTHSSSHSGVNWGPSYRLKPESEQASRKRIEARAHELYLQRGREGGHDLEDWFIAEKELTQR